MATFEKLKENVENWLTDTENARFLSERDRDYKDNIQWTDAERAKIENRGQAPIVVNRIKPKVEGLKGLLISRKTDPKAFARTQKHEKAAEAITDALRFVADNVDFDDIKLDVAENVFVEGYGAAITEVAQVGGEVEITMTHIPWDRYYFDNHSRRLDFKDKRWDGIIIWMDVDEAVETFELSNQQKEELLSESFADGDETFDDRPKWVHRRENRVRIAQHFFLEKGVWKLCYFTHNGFLIEPEDSPYLDEFDQPVNPIEAISANIDRDNNRFGEVRYWIDLQDEINHRRSKFLHLLSVRQTAGRKGAIRDIKAMKRELSKADGHVEYEGEKGDFEVLGTGDMADAQLTLYQDGKAELDAISFNAQLSGERQGDLSGKAIANLQQASINEISSLYNGLANWEKRIYRQFWMRIKQFWGKDKWIRVTDDSTKLRWVGINQQVTTQMLLEEQINDDSLELKTRQEAAALFQQMMSAEDPRLQEIQEVRNDVAELDVDIIIETSLDSVTMQQEQFEKLADIAQTRPEVPFIELVKLSSLRSSVKDPMIKSMEASAQAAGEAQQEATALETATAKSKAELDDAKAAKAEQEAIQTQVQTQLLLETPPDDTGVVI